MSLAKDWSEGITPPDLWPSAIAIATPRSSQAQQCINTARWVLNLGISQLTFRNIVSVSFREHDVIWFVTARCLLPGTVSRGHERYLLRPPPIRAPPMRVELKLLVRWAPC